MPMTLEEALAKIKTLEEETKLLKDERDNLKVSIDNLGKDIAKELERNAKLTKDLNDARKVIETGKGRAEPTNGQRLNYAELISSKLKK